MLHRPAILRLPRRTLITGAAALAMMPRAARAAPSITWNSADKSADVTLSKGDLMASNTATAAFRGVRATGSQSSGKYYAEFNYLSLGGSLFGQTAGVGNSSASLTDYVGQNTNSAGTGPVGNLYYNAGVVSAWPSTSQTATVICLAVDLTNSLAWARLNGGSWYGGGGTTGDPAAGTNGASISSLTGSLFPMVSPYSGQTDRVFANFGFFPWIYGCPSGFSGWDTAAPVSNANGGYPYIATPGSSHGTLMNNDLTIAGNGTATGTDWDTWRMGAAIPAASKVMVSWHIDAITESPSALSTDSGGLTLGFVRSTSTLTDSNLGGSSVVNSLGFLGSGITSLSNNVGGTTTLGTTEIYTVGDYVDMCIDMVNSTMWTRVNGGNWNGSGTANPATNTDGYSFSTIAGASLYIAQSVTRWSAATLNTGVDAFSYSLPSGFTSLYDALLAQGGARSRGLIIQ